MLYFDTSYLVRLYIKDHGADVVRKLAATSRIASSFHGELETIAALHRAYREEPLTRIAYFELLDQFHDDSQAGSFHWLPAGKELVPKLEAGLSETPPPSSFSAPRMPFTSPAPAKMAFTEIYSHDARMLAAAPAFGLKAKNVIK